jgi:predicted dithiol-disulfide oxidoreductase (DUF899 family)
MKERKQCRQTRTAIGEQWLAERLKLLKAEKELTRRSQAYFDGRGRGFGAHVRSLKMLK